MRLPFSHDAFLDVFGAYNAALWPAIVALWAVTVAMVVIWMRRRLEGRIVPVALAVHWAWSGIGYHWMYFSRINPAAVWFGGLFVAQALVFGWLALGSRARFTLGANSRGRLGAALVIYAIAYPLIGVAFGLRIPRMPLFAVPCPTTILTAGLLLTASGVPRVVSLVPLLWAVVGSSAAFALGIRADLALVVAAALLAVDATAPTALGARA
jgi:hypothetical protein